MREKLDLLEALIKNFNWHSPSWDLFILLFWGAAAVLYAMSSGRGRVLSILISIYIAKLMTLEAPFLFELAKKHLPTNMQGFEQLVVFGASFILVFLFVARYAFKTSADQRPVSGFAYVLLFSLLQVGLLINIVVSFIPLTFTNQLSELVKFLFLQPNANFIWLVLPVVFLIFLGRHVSSSSDS